MPKTYQLAIAEKHIERLQAKMKQLEGTIKTQADILMDKGTMGNELVNRVANLKVEREALTATNNSQIDTLRVLRDDVEQLQKALDEPKLNLFNRLKNERAKSYQSECYAARLKEEVDKRTEQYKHLEDSVKYWLDEKAAYLQSLADGDVEGPYTGWKEYVEIKAEVKDYRDLLERHGPTHKDLMKYIDDLKDDTETGHAHAAELAGALEKLLNATNTDTMPFYILTKAQVILDKYRESQGNEQTENPSSEPITETEGA